MSRECEALEPLLRRLGFGLFTPGNAPAGRDTLHTLPPRLRRDRLRESILSNSKEKLRACQSKSPCRPRFVAVAVLQDLRNRGTFDDAQIGRLSARWPGA